MFNLKYWLLAFFLIGMQLQPKAHINPNRESRPAGDQNATQGASYRADCAASGSAIDQAINNVRARLLGGGDVWWDLSDGRYVVPKVDPASGLPEVSSIFAGAVWLGGVDPAGNLKVAGQTYRQSTNNDFWPGPLNPENGTTTEEDCANWDKHWTVTGDEIRKHLQLFEQARQAGADYDPDVIPRGVKEWPARGNRFFFELNGFQLPNTTQGLGAFFDEDGDGLYDPSKGDYPIIEVRGCPTPQFPDEMIFWIYNDNGGIHTETMGDPIQMEIQVQAFAYATNDELNDMTFQRYKLINRAVESIDSMFFAMWVDPDLGCFEDDYIGCDTSRSLMYVYNEDQTDGMPGCDCDGGVATYCNEVPILGVDYFRGPLNELGEEIGMSSFVYFNNPGVGNPDPATTDPANAVEYYRYLSGSWKDGTRITYGGNGYNPGNTELINYVFTDTPDETTNPLNPDGQAWSMCTANLPFGDRRTVQASGPFRLDPGAVNELIIGVPWVGDIETYPCPDIRPLQFADDIAQALFDNCFDITDGPDAPDIDWIELDKELVAILTNDEFTSNNALEEYAELDLQCPSTLPEEDCKYRFEGYKVFQMEGPEVNISDLDDPSKARLIFQVDVKNGINEIFNWTPVEDPGSPEFIWIPESQVEGNDQGIRHTFQIKEDQFAVDDRRLVNHKKYYFTVLAYAYNNFQQFNPEPPIEGQRRSYLEGRRNIQVYTPIPRPIVDRVVNASYGDGAVITRLDGEGVGSNFLAVSEETRVAFLGGDFDGSITYQAGAGPIDVKIFNPMDVKDGNFELTFIDENLDNDVLDNEVRWELTDLNDPSAPILSDRTIDRLNEQIIKEYGFSISITQTADAGDLADASNGAIGGKISYSDASGEDWFMAIPDSDDGIFNYVRTGMANGMPEADNGLDPDQALSTIGGGSFVPYTLCDWRPQESNAFYLTPSWIDFSQTSSIVRQQVDLADLNNVDIVFTSDKSKWSRCVVIETATPFYTDPNTGLGLETEGNVKHFDLRGGLSIDKDGNYASAGSGSSDNPDAANYIREDGMGWFPGYAVDVETGKRLNIFFGENSTYDGSLFPEAFNEPPTGRDMIWNPSSQVFFPPDSTGGAFSQYNFVAGAHHMIYVTKQEYDACEFIAGRLAPGQTSLRKVNALREVTWASIPILPEDVSLKSYADGLIPNDVVVSLRVDNPYAVKVGTGDKKGYPTYQFVIDSKAAGAVDTETEITTALDQINVVPNPYFGFSDYETSQFTNTIKITNLPAECTVTIYSLDGRFIRQYKRDEVGSVPTGSNRGIERTQIAPALEWDLKNSKGIPISSGVYLIHVDAPGMGERVIKWFGVNRQFDPSGL